MIPFTTKVPIAAQARRIVRPNRIARIHLNAGDSSSDPTEEEVSGSIGSFVIFSEVLVPFEGADSAVGHLELSLVSQSCDSAMGTATAIGRSYLSVAAS